MQEPRSDIKKDEKNYFTSFDGCKLFFCAKEKAGPECLIIIHGIGEHSGRYQELLANLQDLPLSIYVLETRGHGRSGGRRMYVEQFFDFTRDVCGFRDWIEQRSGGERNVFSLFGHSLGGLISTSVVLSDQNRWKRLILSSPFFGLPSAEGFLRVLCHILDLIVPRLMWDNPVRPVYLTHDTERVKTYTEDPLVQRRITARLAKEMFGACQSVRRRASELTVPLFIMAAGDERIVSLAETKNFFSRAGSTDKHLEVFDGFYHELIQETERTRPIQLLKDYLLGQ